MNHSYVYPGLGCLGQGFVVPVSSTGQALAQPTRASQPCKCSLNHPSPRQHLELMAASRTPHNLQRPTRQGHDPINQLARVTSISPDQLQAWKPSYQLIDNQLCTISVLDVSGVDHDCQQQSYGVHDDMPCGPSPSYRHHSHEAPFFRRLHALAVYDRRAGRSLSSIGCPYPLAQGLMDLLPGSVLSPFPKIPPHGAPRREVMRHGSPRAAVATQCR